MSEENSPVAPEKNSPVAPENAANTEQPVTADKPHSAENAVVGESTDQEVSAEPAAESAAEPKADSASQGDTIPGDASPVSQSQPKPAGSGPLSLDRIRQLRKSGQSETPRSARTVKPVFTPAAKTPATKSKPNETGSPLPTNNIEEGVIKTPEPGEAAKISVPSRRQPLSQEMEDELSAALGEADLDNMLVGDSMLQVGHMLTEGQRIQGKVMKSQDESVFVSLGGPNEGVVPALQFEEPPEIGSQIEVVVRGYLSDEGLYELTMPGATIEVTDWDDLNEGEVVEAVITGSNPGGLECKVGAIAGFIPASQVAIYRVEDLSEMVDQKVLCVVNEANPRRRNLVLSRRAVLEREKEEKREERLAALNVGDAVDGTVAKLMDFGAFVDIGGLDGLLHISQLSWERVEHPREILEEGQQIQVRIDKIDKQSGKIGLTYRSLQDDPWNDIDERFPVGSIVHGSVTRIAEFGAFVRVATGVEGLVHISELAHHRVQNVSNVVQEGQELDVKIVSVDQENQRIGLSLKAAQAAPEPTQTATDESAEPPPKPVLPKHEGPLKGGTSKSSGGERFGLKW